VRRSVLPLALLLCAALPPRAASAQTSGELLDPKLRDLFHESLSGERAKEHVIAITRHHRIQGSRGYRAAAQYVIGELGRCGFAVPEMAVSLGAFLEAGDLDATWMGGGRPPWTAPGGVLASDKPTAWIESFKSDGRVSYQTWQSPSGWDIDAAELRLMSPTDAPDGERLVGYPEIAMSVITYSNPGAVTEEMVWVGSGEREEDYAGKDVQGKFVLATGYGGAVHRLAVLEHGAAAVVCFLDDSRAADHPDMLQYTGMWPKTPELERTTFGFNLTHRQGARLRDLALAGKSVVLRGSVQGTGLEPYWMDVIVATIPGSEHPEEELVFSAHLDHPKESANDNASGSAAILDIARTLNELIASGRLPRPARTLRFLWVPEWNGTMAYIDAHPELVGPALHGRVLANLNLDMVGENLELLHSRLILTRTPDSLPSCLNDVVEDMARMVDGTSVRTPRGGASTFNWRMTPYSGGSDHMMFIDRKIPAVMFSHDPDYTHHTSEDTPDKVDPVELERCELIATGAAWYLANLTAAQVPDLTALTMAGASSRMWETAGRARQLVVRAQPDAAPAAVRAAWDMMTAAYAVGQAEVDSAGAFARLGGNDSADLNMTSKSLFHALQAFDRSLPRERRTEQVPPEWPADESEERDEDIPIRMTRGPLDFGLPESRLPPERAAWYRPPYSLSGEMRFELVNFIDGKRTGAQIHRALSAEFGPIDPLIVQRYIIDLVECGVVEWKP